MLVATATIPEPFQSRLKIDDVAEICDHEAKSPGALYGRALARIVAGRDSEARVDLKAAMPQLGDPCRVELAFLDIRQRDGDIEDAIVALRFVIERAQPDSLLQARALHVVGLAEGKLRRSRPAREDLFAARKLYSKLNCRIGIAQVNDTLGMLDTALGRLDTAASFYALSLAHKTVLGDKQGMAITLGNFGRLHLRAGRFDEAVACFEGDLELSRELQDVQGQARMHEDLGRTYLAMAQLENAREELAECLRISNEHGIRLLSFFAQKDVVLLCIAEKRLSEADVALQACEQLLPSSADPHLHALVSAARADLLSAKEEPLAVEELTKVVQQFESLELPDLEVPSRISLAEALARNGDIATAEQCLSRGLLIARRAGYARFVPIINEAMCRLDLRQSIVDEEYRKVVRGPSNSRDCYIERRVLGSGCFGDVVLAFDPHRMEDVAIKRLRLDNEYDVEIRKQIVSSARREWEAARKIKHPGVVRVRAIGYEGSGGGMYVVQDYIPGRSLRNIMTHDLTRDQHCILTCMEQVAQALHALHEAMVIHRDLKPENIIIREENGRPVLVDFGIAHIQGNEAIPSGKPYGTIQYMAPEQFPGTIPIDCRADLYAFGVILYEWLTGLPPITPQGRNLEEQMASMCSTRPVDLAEYRSGISPALRKLVMSLLARNPERRPESAYAVAEQLETLL